MPVVQLLDWDYKTGRPSLLGIMSLDFKLKIIDVRVLYPISDHKYSCIKNRVD